MEKDSVRFHAPVLFGIVMSHNENRVGRRFAAFAARGFAAFAVRGEPVKRQLDEVTVTGWRSFGNFWIMKPNGKLRAMG